MMLQKLVSMSFQRSITVDCGEVTVGRRFRNCKWLKRNLTFWFQDFRSIIHRFIAMNLRKYLQPVQKTKNLNCRKRKTECLGPWRQLHVIKIWSDNWGNYRILYIVVGLASVLKDRYRNHWTSSRPRSRQNELSKHICSLNIFNKMESSKKIPTLQWMELMSR